MKDAVVAIRVDGMAWVDGALGARHAGVRGVLGGRSGRPRGGGGGEKGWGWGGGGVRVGAREARCEAAWSEASEVREVPLRGVTSSRTSLPSLLALAVFTDALQQPQPLALWPRVRVRR